jgi:hypothetical protein
MSKFIPLGAVLAMLAAGTSAKTLKIAKSEVHRAAEVPQHRTAEPVDSSVLSAHLQKLRSEGALP